MKHLAETDRTDECLVPEGFALEEIQRWNMDLSWNYTSTSARER